jgi:pSer/pThr/pTyr-binding forkhead associated (FHA) protein
MMSAEVSMGMGITAFVIMIMSGPDDGQKVYLSREYGDGNLSQDNSWTLSFGRREECDVSIPFDTQVSRRHAVLRVTDDRRFFLEDMGSLNGTYVGKARIEEPTEVERGELFRLGRTWMRIQPEEGDE